MAQRLVAKTFSDLTPDEEGEPHELRLDDIGVEVDLTEAEYQELIEVLYRYFAAGRYIDGAKPPKGSPLAKPSGGQPNARPDLSQTDRNGIRAYARLQGWKIGKNGRLPGDYISAWEAAGSPTAAESEEIRRKTAAPDESGQGDLYAEAEEPELVTPADESGAA